MQEIIKGVFLKDSGLNGSTTSIMVGVHGNEFSGIDVLDEIINTLDINYGKVYFIFANLKAIEKKVRYTEKNLNRCFIKGNKGNTYEEKRVLEIIEILKKSDYLLDVHNTISKNSSLEILITKHIDYAKYFNVVKVVSNIDDIQKGGSDGFMDSIGKKGFCLECGSINFGDKNKTIIFAKNSIINFLKVTGNIDGTPEKYNLDKLIINMKLMYTAKTNNCILNKEYEDFEFIKAGTQIGEDGTNSIIIKKDSYILFAQINTKKGQESYCIGEKIK